MKQQAVTALGIVAFVAVFGVVAFFFIQRKSPADEAMEKAFGVPWAPYTPSVGHYTIAFPTKPKETWTSDASPPVTHVAEARIGTDYGPDHEYEVHLTQLPRVGDVEKELDVVIDGDASSHDHTVASRAKITLNGKFPGRAATLKHRDEKTLVRAYIVDGWRYVLVCRGVENDSDAARFLDSFKLVQ